MFSYADHPETIGKVLDSGFKLYKASLKQVLLLSFLGAITSILYTFMPEMVDPYQIEKEIVQFFVIFALVMALGTFFYCAVIVQMHAIAIKKNSSINASIRVALKKFIPILIGSILYLLLVSLGMVVLIIPGIYLSLALFFYGILMLLDNESIIQGLKKSYRLISGNWWRTFALISIPAFIFMALYMVVGIVFGIYINASSAELLTSQDRFMVDLIANIINAAISTFISPLFYAFLLVILHDLKLRKQGIDLEARLQQP